MRKEHQEDGFKAVLLMFSVQSDPIKRGTPQQYRCRYLISKIGAKIALGNQKNTFSFFGEGRIHLMPAKRERFGAGA